MSSDPSASIDHLEDTWRSIDELCSTMSEADWATPTGCPGWSVQDQVSHLVDYEAGALGRPRPDHVAPSLPHTKNGLGEANEIGVDFRRARSGAEVLAEMRDVMADRLAQLRRLTPEDYERETVTPVGPGTVADMLTLRVMDTWSHEQDIRRALGRPGHERCGAADETVEYFARFLPLIVGKRVGPPDGTTVVMAIGANHRSAIEVDGGRAKEVADPAAPTVTISFAAPTFAALVGGRSDAPEDWVVDGDEALAQAIVAQLGFMP